MLQKSQGAMILDYPSDSEESGEAVLFGLVEFFQLIAPPIPRTNPHLPRHYACFQLPLFQSESPPAIIAMSTSPAHCMGSLRPIQVSYIGSLQHLLVQRTGSLQLPASYSAPVSTFQPQASFPGGMYMSLR
jgi:hypothetical protein